MSELRNIKRQLSGENKSLLAKMSNYIYANGINLKLWKEIRLDIAGMLLESQERGEEAEIAFGYSYEKFCDSLIENCPRKKFADNLWVI